MLVKVQVCYHEGRRQKLLPLPMRTLRGAPEDGNTGDILNV